MSIARRARVRWRLARRAAARLRSASLRSQLAVIIATVGLLAIVLNAVLLTVFLRPYLQDQQGRQMARQAADLGHCCRHTSILRLLLQPGALDEAMQVALAGTPERHVVIVTRVGGVSYTYTSPGMSAKLKEALVARLRRDLSSSAPLPAWDTLRNQLIADVRLTYGRDLAPLAPQLAGRTLGGLLLAEDQQVANQRWRGTIFFVLVSGLAAIALAVLGGILAARAVTRPIRNVTAAARGIAGGDYERRVPPAGPAEMREMSLAVNTMVDEVLRQRRIERDLLANVSHELAAPLGLIRGYAEALSDGMLAQEKDRQAALRAISAETTRLGRLSGDLLDLALLETGQVSIHPEPVPVADLLAGLRERFTPKAQRAGIALNLGLAPDLPVVLTDGLRLEQVLVNLLNNALRHTPSGGTVTLAARPVGSELRLEVADTGAGIPPEDLARIWERFYQVDKGRDRRDGEAGVGLGLAICRSTVALLGGRISAASAVGRGTTFTIYLPLRRGAVQTM